MRWRSCHSRRRRAVGEPARALGILLRMVPALGRPQRGTGLPVVPAATGPASLVQELSVTGLAGPACCTSSWPPTVSPRRTGSRRMGPGSPVPPLIRSSRWPVSSPTGSLSACTAAAPSRAAGPLRGHPAPSPRSRPAGPHPASPPPASGTSPPLRPHTAATSYPPVTSQAATKSSVSALRAVFSLLRSHQLAKGDPACTCPSASTTAPSRSRRHAFALEVLTSSDPARAAVAALLVFRAPCTAVFRALSLTHLRDVDHGCAPPVHTR